MAWYNANWDYRVKVTVQSSKVDATLSNFPVYVNLADLPAGFHTNVNQTDARDIRVTTSNGTTECPREVVFYTAASDTGELHFKAPSLSSSANTDFYIYYGNSGASEPAIDSTYGAENVWDSNFKMVQHMKDATTSTVVDSTLNDNDGTKKGANEPATATGKIGAGQDFDGSDDYVQVSDSNSLDITSDLSISFWVKMDSEPDALQIILDKTGLSGNNYQYGVWYDNRSSQGSPDRIRFHYGQGTNPYANWTGANLSSFTLIHCVFDGSDYYIYANGSQVATASKPVNWSAQANALDLFIGNALSNYFFSGVIDELRILSRALTSTWISTEYNNQS